MPVDLPMAGGPPQVEGYPRELTSIHQIEPTSHCNLRCVYCPSPKLEQHRGKPKEHIAIDVFERALEWARYFERCGTQGELSLTGIGETFLHPEWERLVALAREALPDNDILFSTNGLHLAGSVKGFDADAAAAHLAEHRVGVFISLHRPEKAGQAIPRAKRHGIYRGHNASAAIDAFDWAGQVEWEVSADPIPCEYLRTGWGVVMADGQITRCCLDASGKGAFGSVWDEPGSLFTSPWELCGPCHMTIVPPVKPEPYR